jgi:ABC-type transporter Mla subunit MlaD
MGRRSKLTPEQWDEIGRRVAAGDSMSALSAEFGVSKSNISGRFSQKTERIRIVANKLVDASKALNGLPESERPLAVRLADDLKSISLNLTRAAKAGSDTAARLAEMANRKVKQALREDGKVDQEVLMDIASLTVTSNRAASPAMRLVAANQESDATPDTPEDEPDYSTLSMAELDDLERLELKARGGA